MMTYAQQQERTGALGERRDQVQSREQTARQTDPGQQQPHTTANKRVSTYIQPREQTTSTRGAWVGLRPWSRTCAAGVGGAGRQAFHCPGQPRSSTGCSSGGAGTVTLQCVSLPWHPRWLRPVEIGRYARSDVTADAKQASAARTAATANPAASHAHSACDHTLECKTHLDSCPDGTAASQASLG